MVRRTHCAQYGGQSCESFRSVRPRRCRWRKRGLLFWTRWLGGKTFMERAPEPFTIQPGRSKAFHAPALGHGICSTDFAGQRNHGTGDRHGNPLLPSRRGNRSNHAGNVLADVAVRGLGRSLAAYLAEQCPLFIQDSRIALLKEDLAERYGEIQRPEDGGNFAFRRGDGLLHAGGTGFVLYMEFAVAELDAAETQQGRNGVQQDAGIAQGHLRHSIHDEGRGVHLLESFQRREILLTVPGDPSWHAVWPETRCAAPGCWQCLAARIRTTLLAGGTACYEAAGRPRRGDHHFYRASAGPKRWEPHRKRGKSGNSSGPARLR